MKIHHILGKTKYTIPAVLIVSLFSISANATTYYVRTDGNNSNSGFNNNSSEAWETIDYAVDNVEPDDTIRVQPGRYEESVTPGVNGTSVNNMITLVADGDVTVCGFNFNNNNYIRIVGFDVDATAGSCSRNHPITYRGRNNFIEIWNNEIHNGSTGIRVQNSTSELNNAIIIGNTVHNCGLGTGGGKAFDIMGDNNLIAYNILHTLEPDGIYLWGKNNIIRNNYAYNFDPNRTGAHIDFLQYSSHAQGFSENLIEANLYIDNGSGGHGHWYNIRNNLSNYPNVENIVFRNNVIHNLGSGSGGQCDEQKCDDWYYYNNTFYEACATCGSQKNGIVWYDSGWLGNDVYVNNNIFVEFWGPDAINPYLYHAQGNLHSGHNMATDLNGPISFGNAFASEKGSIINAKTDFVNFINDDFRIGNQSDAIGNAGPLTFVIGSSGTGTSFTVENAEFFKDENLNISQYNGNLVAGDEISVGNEIVRIKNISGNTITVSNSFSYQNGDGVYFGADGSRDIGAYPYKQNGYSISASYSKTGSTVSVSPNDVSLVRMVVVFENGIPVGADSISPYVISGVGSGILDVRVYPFYASQKTYIIAGALDSPSNVRIK